MRGWFPEPLHPGAWPAPREEADVFHAQWFRFLDRFRRSPEELDAAELQAMTDRIAAITRAQRGERMFTTHEILANRRNSW